MKAQALVDHLAENSVDDEYQPLSTYFSDEEVNSVEAISEDTNAWKMFFDGAVNANGVGIGAILISPTGQHYPATAQLWFFCTNNTVEYEACIMGMNMAIDQDVEELRHVEDLSKRFKSIEFRYIPRCHNELAYALATLASMLPYPGNAHIDSLEVQIWERHGYCNTVEAEPNTRPWYHDIKRFLKTKEYPKQASGDQQRTIRWHTSGFFLSGDVLYKGTPDLSLLRCIDAKEAERIMYEVHAGVCGHHMNGYVLAKKILRAGYYWITMEKDGFSFVQKCHQCQVHGDLIHAPPTELHPMSTPWLFVAWGMDVIGPIEPKASNGHRFILVAIDYFKKWVEAITLKSVTKKAVVDFVNSNLICRFGIVATIITDNAANLNSHLMREIFFESSRLSSVAWLPFHWVVNQFFWFHLLKLGCVVAAVDFCCFCSDFNSVSLFVLLLVTRLCTMHDFVTVNIEKELSEFKFKFVWMRVNRFIVVANGSLLIGIDSISSLDLQP
ncbi:uncharacterized protein [Nicotiana sylvestris]|uniref:uncharacterized protein n=1 Tax=Nicotiana sylvestris TaxID=4096 RepID=UPI00388CE2FD